MSHPEFFARQTFCQRASLLESAEARGSAAFQAALQRAPVRQRSAGRLPGGAPKADAALGLVLKNSG